MPWRAVSNFTGKIWNLQKKKRLLVVLLISRIIIHVDLFIRSSCSYRVLFSGTLCPFNTVLKSHRFFSFSLVHPNETTAHVTWSTSVYYFSTHKSFELRIVMKLFINFKSGSSFVAVVNLECAVNKQILIFVQIINRLVMKEHKSFIEVWTCFRSNYFTLVELKPNSEKKFGMKKNHPQNPERNAGCNQHAKPIIIIFRLVFKACSTDYEIDFCPRCFQLFSESF